jgi:hypothetical protein
MIHAWHEERAIHVQWAGHIGFYSPACLVSCMNRGTNMLVLSDTWLVTHDTWKMTFYVTSALVTTGCLIRQIWMPLVSRESVASTKVIVHYFWYFWISVPYGFEVQVVTHPQKSNRSIKTKLTKVCIMKYNNVSVGKSRLNLSDKKFQTSLRRIRLWPVYPVESSGETVRWHLPREGLLW